MTIFVFYGIREIKCNFYDFIPSESLINIPKNMESKLRTIKTLAIDQSKAVKQSTYTIDQTPTTRLLVPIFLKRSFFVEVIL